jgi:hypothetical protein
MCRWELGASNIKFSIKLKVNFFSFFFFILLFQFFSYLCFKFFEFLFEFSSYQMSTTMLRKICKHISYN